MLRRLQCRRLRGRSVARSPGRSVAARQAAPAKGAFTYRCVEVVDAVIANATATGATIDSAPLDAGDGIIAASVRLPTGSIVGVMYNSHFEATAN